MGFKVRDHYFDKAKKDKYLARSVYKLEEINQKYKILNKGDQVVDFGYHPGSWIQYTSNIVSTEGLVVGIDIRSLNKGLLILPNKNVRLYEKDIFSVEAMSDLGLENRCNVVLSDMAPNTSGIKSLDQDRSLNLVEKVFDILPVFLLPGGNLVLKVFDGDKAQKYLKDQKKRFETMRYLKPRSTRSVSKEFFVIGINFRA